MDQSDGYRQLEAILEVTSSPVFYRNRFGKDALNAGAEGREQFQLYEKDYPTVYILHSPRKNKKGEAYVGETCHFRTRMRSHLKNGKRRRLERVVAIGCETFNKSATYNIESNLISCMLADGAYVLQNERQTSSEFVMHNYFGKPYYDGPLFQLVWDELIRLGIARNALEVVKNRDVFKLSPYKQLSASQNELVQEAVRFCEAHVGEDGHAVFLIRGDAGTGKSVVLSSLFKTLVDRASDPSSTLSGAKSRFVVNHTEQLKTYHDIARGVEGLRLNQFMKPTSFINAVQKGRMRADVVVVDEAHLLLSRSDAFNSYKGDNHLREIVENSRVAIIVYDDRQVLKMKSYWDRKLLQEALASAGAHVEFELTEQFRMQADQSVIDWIEAFVGCKEMREFPKARNDGAKDEGFEFRVFADAVAMHEAIRKKNDEESLSRVIATFDYEHKKDGRTYYVEEGSFKLPWNKPKEGETWAERDETIDEVGSIYTVQGFDLNYAGVILGPSITYDRQTDRIKVLPERYRDTEAFKWSGDFPVKEIPQIKERIILNSVNVLMKRAMKGLYLYASDDALRKRLMELQEESLAREYYDDAVKE